MSEVSEFLEDVLKHEYDAQKAHEYYLRTRELQGHSRDPDMVRTPVRSAVQPKSSPISKKPATKAAVRKPAAPKETIEQRRARIAAATEQLKAKLEQLREVLRKLVDEAKIRSGGEAVKDGAKPAAEEKPSEQTPAEKADQAKKAHDYYEKHKAETPEDSIAALQQKIAAVEAKIREMREKIAKRRASAVGAELRTQ